MWLKAERVSALMGAGKKSEYPRRRMGMMRTRPSSPRGIDAEKRVTSPVPALRV